MGVLFKLVIPTIIFSSLIYIPKIFFHSRELSLEYYIYDVFGGVSFWFTSALAVSQIVLLIVLSSGLRKLRWFSLLSLIIIFSMPLVKDCFPGPFPWYFKSGLGAVVLMVIGGYFLYIQSKFKFPKFLSWGIFLCYAAAVIANFIHPIANYALMSVTVNTTGAILSLLGVISIVIISKMIRTFDILQFIGENSIILYFFSGTIPAFLTSLIKPENSNALTTLCFGTASILLGVIVTKFIMKWMPFMTDLRLLYKKS